MFCFYVLNHENLFISLKIRFVNMIIQYSGWLEIPNNRSMPSTGVILLAITHILECFYNISYLLIISMVPTIVECCRLVVNRKYNIKYCTVLGK